MNKEKRLSDQPSEKLEKAILGGIIVNVGPYIEANVLDTQSLLFGHVHDTTVCLGAAMVTASAIMPKRLSNIQSSLLWFSGSSLLEIGQYFEAYKGTFDPWDFLAYAVGSSVAYVINDYTDKVKKS